MDDPGYRARFHADAQEREARQHPTAYADVQVLPDEIDNAQVAQAIDVPQVVDHQTGYEVHGYRPPPAIDSGTIPGALQHGTTGLQGGQGAAGPVKGTQEAQRLGMRPHLQMLCGPMLRYDTTVNGIYHLFALVVTRDEGSDYSTSPTITYRYGRPSAAGGGPAQGSLDSAMQNMDISSQQQTFKTAGQKIWIYHSLSGANSFWRMKLEIKLSPAGGFPIHYSLNGGREITFHVPGANENFRWVGHSCNGFSAGVDTEAFNGPSPLWEDLLRKHAEKPIHVLVGGGDQIYCDAIAREPELIPWIDEKDDNVKMAAPATPEIRFAIDRFLFNHYTTWFRNGAFGRAIACIPMLNMLDDHDLIDGFGSYPADLQSAPVFSVIGSRGIFFYKLFQLFQCDEVDGTGASSVPHPMKSLIIGGQGPWVPFNSASFLTCLGPNVYMLLLDCRTERKKERIVSEVTYQRVFDAVRRLPDQVNHVVLLTGVPIAYPRMVFVESFLASKMNPLILLGKSGVAGFTGLVNRMNKDAELLDDLNDHWTAKAHKEERNWLVLQLQKIAIEKHVRVSIISGDVHLAAVGRFFTHKGKIEPAQDPKYMLNVVSSAIVNTPPPQGIVGLQGKLNRTHKTLHHENTDENMVELFDLDTDGSKLRNHCFMGRRNYCISEVEPNAGLKFDIRVEIAQGVGETKGYSIITPAPGW